MKTFMAAEAFLPVSPLTVEDAAEHQLKLQLCTAEPLFYLAQETRAAAERGPFPPRRELQRAQTGLC